MWWAGASGSDADLNLSVLALGMLAASSVFALGTLTAIARLLPFAYRHVSAWEVP
jgi:hypothetical protein